jgi:hypothetical protein
MMDVLAHLASIKAVKPGGQVIQLTGKSDIKLPSGCAWYAAMGQLSRIGSLYLLQLRFTLIQKPIKSRRSREHFGGFWSVAAICKPPALKLNVPRAGAVDTWVHWVIARQ